MALVVVDGFDTYGSQADLQSRVGTLQWSEVVLVGGSNTFELITGRDGSGQAVGLYGDTATTATLGGSFSASLVSGTIGLAIKFYPGCPAFADLQIMDYIGFAPQATIRLTPLAGGIQVYTGDPQVSLSGLLAQSSANAFSPYVWNFFEIQTTVDPTNGRVQVNVNGNPVLTATGATSRPPGQGTNNPVSTTFDGFRVRLGATPGDSYSLAIAIDDFYLADTTTGPGTYPCSSFLGDVSVITVRPTANKSVTWTPLQNTNWQEVGTPTFEGDASYNSATAVGSQDLFTFGSLPTNVLAVFGVQTLGAYRKLNASAQTITQDLVSGGTAATGAPVTLSLDYTSHANLWTVDPNTNGTWTAASVNALVGGYTLAS